MENNNIDNCEIHAWKHRGAAGYKIVNTLSKEEIEIDLGSPEKYVLKTIRKLSEVTGMNVVWD